MDLFKKTAYVTRWSEYTLYRLSLDSMKVFEAMHVEESREAKIICQSSIWFAGDLPWNVTETFNGNIYRNTQIFFALL